VTQVRETEWARLARAALVGGVSRSTLDRAAATDELPFVWLDGVRHFALDDVHAWAVARGRQGNGEDGS
jgi:hypothetical protein